LKTVWQLYPARRFRLAADGEIEPYRLKWRLY
jgi:hypothetical protein